MKICYLILAHNNFIHLDRLINALDDADVMFYIHLDEKAAGKYISGKENVIVIPHHQNINWGGYGMVEATLALLRYSNVHSPQADYFALISGVDYPIRPRSFFYNQLARGKEFIDAAPMPFLDKPMKRFEYYYFDIDRRRYGYFHPKIVAEMALCLFRIKRKVPFKLYVGGQWFALTRQCVEYVLDTVDENKRYERFFRHSLIPDEAFFQTIIAHSPFAANIVPNMTYTDWTGPNPPVNIGMRHIDFFAEHTEIKDEYGIRYPFFARKFDDDSGSVIDAIEQVLRS